MTSQDHEGLFTHINGTTDEVGGQGRQSTSQFAGDSIDDLAAQKFTSGSSRVDTENNNEIGPVPLKVAEEKFDPKIYPATALARRLQLRCRCDDCEIDRLVCSLKDGPPDADTKAKEQAARQRRRAVLAPGARKWMAPTAHEISWADTANGRARLLLLANYGCAHIRLMVREHQDGSMAGCGLPDVDALEAAEREKIRAKWHAKRFPRRPVRRRVKTVFRTL